MSMSHPGVYAVILILVLAPPIDAQDSDAVSQVNKLLSRDPNAAISAAREFLDDQQQTKVDQAKLTHLWGRGLTMTQDFPGALVKLDEAKRLAKELGDQQLLMRILQAEAVACCEDGDFRRGADAARAGIEIADAKENELLSGILHSELGTNLCGLSDYEGAIAAFSTALDVARKINKPKLQALALGNLASIYDELGNFARATELHREALQFFENSKNEYSVATTKVNLATSLLDQDLIDQAEPLLKETVELAKKLNLLNVLALAHVGCGDVALSRNNIEQAKREYDLAGECWKQLGDLSGILGLVERYAKVAKLENPESPTNLETIEELEKAFSTALAMGHKKQALAIAIPLITEYESQQEWQQALQLTKQVAQLNQQIWSRENKILLGEAESLIVVLQKEKQIRELNHTNQLQELELQNQKGTRLLYAVALGLSFIVIGVTWRLLSVRRKAYQTLQHAHAERRRQEQRQIELERKLADENKTESLRIMAGGIAHDFNNLLSGIVGQAEVGQLQTDAAEKNQHFDQIIDVASQASDLTSQLISFAGISVNRSSCVDLVKVLGSTNVMLKSIANPVAEVNLHLSEKELLVIGDETQIRQVLVNLVKNASEAIEHAGEITISTGRKHLSKSDLSPMPLGRQNAEGEYCFVKVQDTGSGLEPQLLQKIFDPFFSTKFVGRGLGLASVMGIVRSHRGAISVESLVDMGTSITVYLPLASHQEIIQSSTRPPTAQSAANGWVAGQMGVMFVDDDPLVRQSATSILTAFGFQVFAAESAEESLQVVERNRDQIRVAVIDFAMTGQTGTWLAEQLRDRAPEIIRILCSGYTEDVIRKPDLFVAFLPKPYFAMDLVELLQRSVSPPNQIQGEQAGSRTLEVRALKA